MDVGTTLKSSTKTAEPVQPSIGAFDDPTDFAEAATVEFAASGNRCGDAGSVQRSPVLIVVVSPVCINSGRLAKRSATHAANRRDGIDKRKQLRDVVTVRACQDDRERRTVGVGGKVVFGTGSRAIGGVRSSFSPAPTARTEVESMTTREKSIRSAARNFTSRISWSRSQTPACCQSRKRRQQLMPDPQPISAGKSLQRMPLLSTNSIPVSAARSATGLRPGYRKRLGLAGGRSGSINAHNSSSMIGLAISSLRLPQWSRLTALPLS
ncbi:hypothetical protein HDG37_007779 [Paraburkholderia sp. MM5384-R2]|nr:hypothetical protein [Paraburkholderia sp. MM5384-R2]